MITGVCVPLSVHETAACLVGSTIGTKHGRASFIGNLASGNVVVGAAGCAEKFRTVARTLKGAGIGINMEKIAIRVVSVGISQVYRSYYAEHTEGDGDQCGKSCFEHGGQS